MHIIASSKKSCCSQGKFIGTEIAVGGQGGGGGGGGVGGGREFVVWGGGERSPQE